MMVVMSGMFAVVMLMDIVAIMPFFVQVVVFSVFYIVVCGFHIIKI